MTKRQVPDGGQFEEAIRDSIRRSGGYAQKIPGASAARGMKANLCKKCRAKPMFAPQGPYDLAAGWADTVGIAIECKRSGAVRLPINEDKVKSHQIRRLIEHAEGGGVAGLAIYLAPHPNVAFFLPIDRYLQLVEGMDRKSISLQQLVETAVHLPTDESIGRTRRYFDVEPLRALARFRGGELYGPEPVAQRLWSNEP